MEINTSEKKEIAELILGLRKSEKRKSTLQMALLSARYHTGITKQGGMPTKDTFWLRHNLEDKLLKGEDIDILPDESELPSSLTLYLICLEQLGTLFCEDGDGDNNGIFKSIACFSPKKFKSEEIEAIKNLRHSLAHNFGLVSFNSKKPTDTKYKYIIYYNDSEKNDIVRLPDKPWDGDWSDKSERTSCLIYAFSLMRLIEQIILRIQTRYKENKLEFAIKDLEEIKARFTVL